MDFIAELTTCAQLPSTCQAEGKVVPRAQVTGWNTGTIWPWQEQDQPVCDMQALWVTPTEATRQMMPWSLRWAPWPVAPPWRPPWGDTVLDQPKSQTWKTAVMAQEVCLHFRGWGGWLMPGRVPPESVCRLREVPVRQGSPCRDGWSIRGEGRKVSHQLGGCIEHGLGNKEGNILTQICEKQSKI